MLSVPTTTNQIHPLFKFKFEWWQIDVMGNFGEILLTEWNYKCTIPQLQLVKIFNNTLWFIGILFSEKFRDTKFGID